MGAWPSEESCPTSDQFPWPRLLDTNWRVPVITWPSPLILQWEEHSPEEVRLSLGWLLKERMMGQGLEVLALCLGPYQRTAALPHIWPLKCTFLTAIETLSPENLAPPSVGEPATTLGRRQAGRTLALRRLRSGKDPFPCRWRHWEFLPSRFSQDQRSCHSSCSQRPAGRNSLCSEPKGRSLGMASWKSDLDSPSPSCPEALLPCDPLESQGKLPEGQGMETEPKENDDVDYM